MDMKTHENVSDFKPLTIFQNEAEAWVSGFDPSFDQGGVIYDVMNV